MLGLLLVTLGWGYPLAAFEGALADPNQRWMIGVAAAALFALGVYTVLKGDGRRSVQHTVVKTTQLGEVSISLDAVEELVVKSAKKVLGVREIKPIIKTTQQGIAILIKGRVNSEENIPQISVQLQDVVRETIENIAGVTVVEVKVHIEGVAKDARGRVE